MPNTCNFLPSQSNPTLTHTFSFNDKWNRSFHRFSLFALDGGRTDPCEQDNLAYANDSQISEKVKLPVGCGHVRCTVSTYTDIQAYPSSPTSTDLTHRFSLVSFLESM
jgi:hypothetical protein